MLQRSPGRVRDGDSWWPTAALFCGLLLAEALLAVLWIHYLGPLPVQP